MAAELTYSDPDASLQGVSLQTVGQKSASDWPIKVAMLN